MASLMLASADLLLNSSRVSDKDLECILSVICNLVTKAGSEAEALQTAQHICEKLIHKPDDKPAPRLKVLFTLYNLLPSPYGKALVYKKALELAAAGKVAEHIIPSFKNIDNFISEWGIGSLEQRELFLAVVRILKDQKGMTKEYFDFLNKYLDTFKGSEDEAEAIGAAKQEAVAAIIEFVKSSNLFQCDLLSMPAVAQLEKNDKYRSVYDLLKIFLRGLIPI